MSWKSFVSLGLLCVLASPALAAPTLNVDISGNATVALNSNGDWVWRIGIDPVTLVNTDGTTGTGCGGGDCPPSTPLAVELGFTETNPNKNIVGATKNATNFDRNNPGGSNAAQLKIFGWEQTTDVDPSTTGTNLRPVGLQAQCAGCVAGPAFSNATFVSNGAGDQVAAYLGSIDFTSTGVKQFIEIVVQGPKAGPGLDVNDRSTSLSVRGAYDDPTIGGTSNTAGRIAALNPAADFTQPSGPGNFHAINFDRYEGNAVIAGILSGAFTRTATPGDTDLQNNVNLDDLGVVLANFNTGVYWQQGNFHGNGTGVTNLDDLGTVLQFFNSVSGGGGSDDGGSDIVPEPATVSLFALGILGFWGLASRRRK